MYVESYSPLGGFNEGFVYIEDMTTLTYGTYGLTYVTGPPLVGNSADYIVEHPCCRGSNLYTLANYVWSFWANSKGVDFYHLSRSTHSVLSGKYVAHDTSGQHGR
jgi:hypothetical protein